MKRTFLFIAILLCTQISFGQIEGAIIKFGEKGISNLVEKRKVKKMKDLATKNTSYFKASDGRDIAQMRVGVDDIESLAINQIIGIQKRLDNAYHLYQKGVSVEDAINGLSYDIKVIENIDRYWVLTYYEMELNFYENYEEILQENVRLKKQLYQDSLKIAKEKELEVYYAKQKEEQRVRDSIRYEKRLALEKYREKQRLLRMQETARQDSLRHVRRLEMEKERERIKKEDAAKSKTEIQTKSKVIYSSPVPAKTPVRPSTVRKYYRGSRGGCFYYNSSGKKQYVDRSLCN